MTRVAICNMIVGSGVSSNPHFAIMTGALCVTGNACLS